MSGVALSLVGVLIVSQVIAGDLLGRLGFPGTTPPKDEANVDPKSGVPNQDPNLPPVTDPQGRIY